MEKVRKLSLQAFREHVYGLGAPPSAVFNEEGARSPIRSFNSLSYRDAVFLSSLDENIMTANCCSSFASARGHGRSSFGPAQSHRHQPSSTMKHQSTPAVLVQCSRVSIGLTIDVLGCVKGSRLPRRVLPCSAGTCSEKTLARQVPRPWTSSL